MLVARRFELVGRENELARVRRLVEGPVDGSWSAVIRGEPGIGKTALWRAGLETAQQAGIRVLLTRCAESEMPVALGGAGDLLEIALAEVTDELAEPHRHALSVVLGLEAPPEEAPDPTVASRAFLAYLRALASRSPVLVAIDDLQWLDPPSQRILAFAARRLGEAPVGILATQRGGAGDPLDLRRAFDERVTHIQLGPLSIGALHHLIRTRLGIRMPRPTVARVHAASGGNPMFALEFAQVSASAGEPLPVPSSLEELVRERLNRLPPAILPLLAAVASLERPTLSRLTPVVDDATVLLDTASAACAVTVGPDGVVRFTHPLLASAAYAAVQPVARQALHARLAAATTDPEERARHVALSTFEPDAAAAGVLEEAAARAAARGAPDAAAGLTRHAIRLTPPADIARSEERALAAATYLTDAGQMARAELVLDELLAGPVSGDRRARALLLGFLVESDLENARRLTEEALEHARDPALRARALLTLGTYPLEQGDLARCESMVREALGIAEGVGDPVLLSAALMCFADVADLQGRPEPTLIERAVDLADSRPPLKGFITPRLVLAKQRLSAGDVSDARELLERELDATRIWGDEGLAHRVILTLFDLEWQAGNWERAEQYLEEERHAAFDGGYGFGEAVVLARRALLAASRGSVDEARRLALETVSRGEELHLPWLATLGRWVLGFLALSLAAAEDAWDALRDVPETLGALVRREVARTRILPDAIEAAVASGRLREAEARLTQFETDVRVGGHRWAASGVLRCRALLLLARGESEAALASANDAASGFEVAGVPLDRGRALLVAGEALRRLGERRRAAEKLAAAQHIFAELGAPLWVARAETELRRASPRPRRDGDLTSAERRVAALVAAGRTNREVAAQLFTTVGTVEVHLTRIYRKQGVRSRTELARLVAEGVLDLEGE